MSYRCITLVLLLFTFLSACKDEPAEEGSDAKEAATEATKVLMPYKLINEYPHNANAYTEGLQYVDGYMYESTGHYGKSVIRKYNLETGRVAAETKLDDVFFGEGMTVLGDKVYMLTWREQTGLIFDKSTLKLTGKFPIRTAEGWGMTNDTVHLIYGDGTQYLYFLNPQTFEEVKRIEVKDKYGPVTYINELEYINGYIYANQWETEFIYKIDPNSGTVVAQADLRRLRKSAGIPERRYGNEQLPEVMNGIAYDRNNNRIFITGKNWPKTLEITLDN